MIRSTTTAAALLAASLLTLAQAPASAAFITTAFDGTSGGNAGRGVYFDIDVGPNDLTIVGLATNTDDMGSPVSGFDIYTRLGTAQGAETIDTGWTLVTSGTITPLGTGNASPVVLDTPIMLEADTLYGFGLVYPVDINYSIADGCTGGAYSLTGNCFASNSDLTLLLGSSRNPPFTAGSINSPRIFNGTIEYEVAAAPLPGTLALLGLGLAGIRLARRRR